MKYQALQLDISCEASAKQRINMKHQALFSSKDKSKNQIKVSPATILPGSLRVNLSHKYLVYVSVWLY